MRRPGAPAASHGEQMRPWNEMLAKYAERLPQGVEPHDALGYLLEAQVRMDADPRGSLAHLMQHYQLDPMAFVPPEVLHHWGELEQQALQARHHLAAMYAEQAQREKAQKAEAARRAEEQEIKVRDAQKAARLNVRSSSAIPNPKTMDDTINSIATRLYGR
jgi:hypothetical protein